MHLYRVYIYCNVPIVIFSLLKGLQDIFELLFVPRLELVFRDEDADVPDVLVGDPVDCRGERPGDAQVNLTGDLPGQG